MALITCPECGRPVSSEAERCIHCGYILIKKQNVTNSTPETHFMALGIIGIVFGGIGYIVMPIIFNVLGLVFGIITYTTNPKPVNGDKNTARTIGLVAVWMNAVGVALMIFNIIYYSTAFLSILL